VAATLPDPGPGLQKALADGLRVFGAVASQPETEPFGKGQTWKGQRWNIDLQFVNETPWPLELGKDFFLYEADANFGNINGVALFRGHRPKNESAAHLMNLPVAEPFGLANNYLWFGEDGAIVHVRGTRSRIDDLERHPD